MPARKSRQAGAASVVLCSTLTLPNFVGPRPGGVWRRPWRVDGTPEAPVPLRAPRRAFLPLWHHDVGMSMWQRLASYWPWQKPKPEPHVLHVFRDALHGLMWPVDQLWQATGLGPWLGLFWTALSPYPPFCWLQWLLLKVWHLPQLYRLGELDLKGLPYDGWHEAVSPFSILYFLADNVWKWLMPSFREEVMAGLFLAMLHRYNPKAYVERVVNRVASLLNKQTKLLAPKGVRAQLPEELLETLCIRLRNDGQLLEALGRRRILRMWPRLRRLSTLDPISGLLAQCYVLFTGHLLQRRGGADVASAYTDNRHTLGSLSFPINSKEAWVLKTLIDGYYREVEAVVKEAALVSAAQEAAAKMRILHEAMDSARLASKEGGLSRGTGGLMTQVDTASASAADAIIALGQAKVEAQDAAARVGKDLGKTWQAKMDELMDVHKALPDVVAELRRLDPEEKGSKGSSGSKSAKGGKKPKK